VSVSLVFWTSAFSVEFSELLSCQDCSQSYAAFTSDTCIPDEQLVSGYGYKWIHVAVTTVLSPIQDSSRVDGNKGTSGYKWMQLVSLYPGYMYLV